MGNNEAITLDIVEVLKQMGIDRERYETWVIVYAPLSTSENAQPSQKQ